MGCMYCYDLLVVLFRKHGMKNDQVEGFFGSSLVRVLGAYAAEGHSQVMSKSSCTVGTCYCTNYVTQGLISCVLNYVFTLAYGWKDGIHCCIFGIVVGIDILMRVLCLI